MSTKQEKATAPIRTMQPHPDMEKWLSSPSFRPQDWVYERKFDGVRCLYDPATDECYSRSGTMYKNFDFLKASCKEVQKYVDVPIVFDGEVYGVTFKDVSEQLFRESDMDTSNLSYVIFDIIIPNMTYDERVQLLHKAMEHTPENSRIHYATTFELTKDHTPERIRRFVKEVPDFGWEGVVFKKKTSLYEPGKKSIASWVKGLVHHTEDLVVTGVVEGKGKLAGCVGKFLCGDFTIAPGKATHAQLKHWWEHQEDVPKIIEVSYKSSTGRSLRHPRFVRARYDK